MKFKGTKEIVRLLRKDLFELRQQPKFEWLDKTPDVVRDYAVQTLAKAIKTSIALMGTGKWTLHYRAKKMMAQETIGVPARTYGQKRKNSHWGFVKNMRASRRDALPSETNAQYQIIRTRFDEYFVVMLEEYHMSQNIPQGGVVSLDPGVRTFQTCYSADGMVYEWGDGDMKQVFALCRFADKLHSKWNKETNKRRRKSQKLAWLRMLRRIRNRIDECHRKLSTFLCRTFSTILLPKFETSRMVRKLERKIRRKTARQMCSWSHFRFRERLIAKAELSANANVIICDEQYTTKTCGKCGCLHRKIGSNKTFRCPSTTCDHVADRDVNAARNILLRYLTVNGVTVNFGDSNGDVGILCPNRPPRSHNMWR